MDGMSNSPSLEGFSHFRKTWPTDLQWRAESPAGHMMKEKKENLQEGVTIVKMFKLKIPAQQRAEESCLCTGISAQQEGNHVWY